MQVDDPPYLSVGTGVSAKYKGAFCEAKVSKVTRIVKCKVTYKMGLGNATLSDEQIKGTLRVGQVVQAKHPDRKELVEATITKIQDCSQYTVVFDDGDITTLKRSALCIKSGRHFNESESLDQLPLTHPEHFSSPVVGSNRRGRRNRQLKDDDSEEEIEEENEPDLEGYVLDIGRVVSVESSDKKKNKDNWFPGLVVIPSAQPTVRINIKEEFLVRSFKDGRYYTVPKKEVIDFRKEMSDKVESAYLSEAIQKALRFMEHNELPPHWEKRTLFHSSTLDSDSEEIFSDSSDDEPCEEKDRFVAQLYKFLDEAGTPLNKTPTIASRDVDLHKLFRVVQKLGGFNKVTNQNKWRTVTMKLRFPNTQNIINQVKAVYKKCLSSYEIFYRTLGVTMLNHTPSSRKDRGRSLIRDKDRTTPINPPTLEKEEDSPGHDKKEESNRRRSDKKRLLSHVTVETSDREVDNSESKDSGKAGKDRTDSKSRKDKKKGEKVKTLIEKFEEHAKKAEDEKVQNTRSKSQPKLKEPPGPPDKKSENKPQTKASAKTPKKASPAVSEDEKKKGKKRTADDKSTDLKSDFVNNISVGDKLKVYYGPTHESKVTYEAKVLDIDKESSGHIYLVHYTGWNTRYDEWIQPPRIAENLSASTKAKRLKQGVANPTITSKAHTPKPSTTSGKTKRISSGNSRTTTEAPRSTTPSSVTSSESRTKSPAVPATRSAARLTRRDSSRQKDRRISATDISIHTESESEESDSETDMVTTRSGLKTEETEVKTYRRRNVKSTMAKSAEKKRENDTDKEEDTEKPQKRSKRLIKKSPEKSTEESEDEGNPPKGRDFDLNQIRSELKGFSKAIKVANIDTSEKNVFSSDDSTNPPILEKLTNLVEEEEDQEETVDEKEFEKVDVDETKSLQSSEDIYEFKEPEPFEFEKSKLNDDKNTKKRMPRIFEELEKSPKKKSPKMSPKQESPDRKSYKRSPLKRQDSSDEEETILPMSPPNEQDPFDKLIESPSFNLVKTVDKQITLDKNKIDGVARNLNSDDSLSLFRELPETEDDCSKDMELSDCESQTQIFTRESEIFSEGFSSKPSPDHNTMDMEFSSGKTDESKMKDFDDEDLQQQIQRVIAQSSSTDDDSNDLLMAPSTSSYHDKKNESDPIPTITSILGISPTATVVVPRHDKNYEEFSKVMVQDEEIISSPAIVSPVVDKSLPVEELPFIEKKAEKLPDIDKSPVTDKLPAAEDSTEKEQELSVNHKILPSADEPADIKASTSTNEEIKEKTSDIDHSVDPEKISSIIEAPFSKIEKLTISPALQETDSALLESIVSETPISLDVKLEETAKELSSVKTGTKIADSILQKINSINEMRCKSPNPEKETNENAKTEFTFEIPREDTKHITAESELPKEQSAIITEDQQSKQRDKRKTKTESSFDVKKKKIKTSKTFIEETESDSSDSEQLIIARSDEDSQSNTLDMNICADIKESDSSNTCINAQVTDDSQSKEERNFNFDLNDIEIEQKNEPIPEPVENEYMDSDIKPLKEDEPDPHLHSLLLCEEEIPRSPAPPTENMLTEQTKPKSEMPFASAPGSSSTNKNIILEQSSQKRIMSPVAMEVPLAERAEKSTIMDHTPPTTPESTISNLSPRNERIDISPNHGDESKSNDIDSDYPRQKRNPSLKVSSYSEEDTQMTGDQALLNKKTNQDIIPQHCKKRRKSLRNSDDSAPPPLKKSKKSLNRSRQNSDSDTSEHSNGPASASSTKMSSFNRGDRSPRPSKYNFSVELDPNLDSSQRIAVITQKLSELRKTYADVKAELAVVERRRKKIRRREREALKAAKQEMACA